MRNPRFYLYLSILLVHFYTQTAAQTVSQQAIWYGYNIRSSLTEKWYNETELMERHLINPFLQSQFFVRTRFHKNLNPNTNYGLGGSVFLFHHSVKSKFNQPEFRPHGELNLRAKMGTMNLENRFRGELRFFQNIDQQTEQLENGHHFAAARFRYRLQALFSILQWSKTKSLNFKVANEIMAMAGGQVNQMTFDQNRISADLSIRFSPQMSLDLGYVNWHQARTQGGYLDQHILRTVIKHQLGTSKK